MRRWLKRGYGSLAALNRQWGSRFADWSSVVPMTTAEAMKRSDGNYSAWADFKEWMDVAFSRALKIGSDAIHAVDPEALSAIEGAQIPGWGGYDYSRLATSVDAMEQYDSGENLEMLRSFNPNAVIMTTSFLGGAVEKHRVWRELLRGTRGLILWDPDNKFVGKDGAIGDRGRDAAPPPGGREQLLRELLAGRPVHHVQPRRAGHERSHARWLRRHGAAARLSERQLLEPIGARPAPADDRHGKLGPHRHARRAFHRLRSRA
jgi:hypothetical protein